MDVDIQHGECGYKQEHGDSEDYECPLDTPVLFAVGAIEEGFHTLEEEHDEDA